MFQSENLAIHEYRKKMFSKTPNISKILVRVQDPTEKTGGIHDYRNLVLKSSHILFNFINDRCPPSIGVFAVKALPDPMDGVNWDGTPYLIDLEQGSLNIGISAWLKADDRGRVLGWNLPFIYLTGSSKDIDRPSRKLDEKCSLDVIPDDGIFFSQDDVFNSVRGRVMAVLSLIGVDQ